MNNVSIVLIPVDYANSRKACESLENSVFNTYSDLLSKCTDELNVKNSDGILIYRLTDFMDQVNDQHLDNLTEYFITYVSINN